MFLGGNWMVDMKQTVWVLDNKDKALSLKHGSAASTLLYSGFHCPLLPIIPSTVLLVPCMQVSMALFFLGGKDISILIYCHTLNYRQWPKIN